MNTSKSSNSSDRPASSESSRRLFAAGKAGPWSLDKADLTPVVPYGTPYAGTDESTTRPCSNGCIGPFTRRPDLERWLARIIAEVGYPTTAPLPQYHCAACGTDRGFTAEQLKKQA